MEESYMDELDPTFKLLSKQETKKETVSKEVRNVKTTSDLFWRRDDDLSMDNNKFIF